MTWPGCFAHNSGRTSRTYAFVPPESSGVMGRLAAVRVPVIELRHLLPERFRSASSVRIRDVVFRERVYYAVGSAGTSPSLATTVAAVATPFPPPSGAAQSCSTVHHSPEMIHGGFGRTRKLLTLSWRTTAFAPYCQNKILPFNPCSCPLL